MNDSCQCSERKQPLKCDMIAGDNRRPRQWFVARRNESRSAFNGYRRTWSDYSIVNCRVCGAFWRTKAKFVSELEDCEYFPSKNPPKVESVC